MFVVGGSSGIGRATAERLAAQGAHLALCARNPERLSATATACEAAGASRVITLSFDVTCHDATAKGLGEAIESLGPPALVVHCAGQARPHRFEDIDVSRFDATIKANLYGTYNVVAAVVPAMKPAGGTIVTVSSVAGLVGVYGYADYCASKFGVIGLSEVLRQELAEYGIAVSVLCPPDTDTPGFAVENETKPAATRALSGGAGLMSAEAVAEALLAGVERGRFLIIPGTDGKLTHLAKRFVPGLVQWWITRTIRKTHRRG